MSRRRFGRRRGRSSRKLPILSIAIVAGQALLANQLGGDIAQKLDIFQSWYSGVSFTGAERFQAERLVVGYAPWLALRFIKPIVHPGQNLGRMLPVSLS
jgi:hypothetical protein